MGKFYITTAIDYVNAPPHLGHVYEKIAADVIARWKRLEGEDVFFLTGTDENAQKNVEAARKAGESVAEFVDRMAELFKELCRIYSISHDRFIRTTEKGHFAVAQKIFQKIFENGDIYKGKYRGLYCQGCEAFYTEKDLVDGKCPEHETKPRWIEEENYFFRLSEYREKVLEHIRKNPEFIQPVSRRNEILSRLKEPLRDLSVSRFKVEWGIPVPFDECHRIYVWKEALENYLSGLDYPGNKFQKFWPADIHMVGVGINWFHSVIWPAILISAGLPLPKKVFVHGYVNIGGKKMSKSRGAVVDPLELVERYPADAVRYFLIREIPFGEDGDFSEEALKARINGELLSDLGNLASRVLTLAERFQGKVEGEPELEKKLGLDKIRGFMDSIELHRALDGIFGFVRECNAYINEKEPWKLSGKELSNVMYNLLEGLRVLAILLGPFIPVTAEEMNKQIGVKPGLLKDARFGEWKGKARKGRHLFERVE